MLGFDPSEVAEALAKDRLAILAGIGDRVFAVWSIEPVHPGRRRPPRQDVGLPVDAPEGRRNPGQRREVGGLVPGWPGQPID